MHPSPNALQDMTNAELASYRAELLELEAEHGRSRYADRITEIDDIVSSREHSTEPLEQQAWRMGADAARAAASWAADGNSDEAAIRETLRMLEDGDPKGYDRLPARPDLSGDSMTPGRLYEDVTGRDAHADSTFNLEAYDRSLEALCDAWEAGVDDTFEDACRAELVRWIS